MHQAPAVYWQVARTRFQGALVLVLLVLVLGVHTAWWVQSGQSRGLQFAAGVAVAVACVVSCLLWVRAPTGAIHWDGQAWTWVGAAGMAQAGTPTVTIDLQFTMLVRFERHDRRRSWFWVGLADDRAQWQALRRALFSTMTIGTGDTLPVMPASEQGVARR